LKAKLAVVFSGVVFGMKYQDSIEQASEKAALTAAFCSGIVWQPIRSITQ